MSLVVVGSVAYDGLTTPAGKVERALGGACTYISLAASYFTKVDIVGIVGEDFDQKDYDFLDSRGIGLEGLERVPGKTFFWAGVYSDDMNDRETLTTDLNVFADFNPKLPETYRKQPYLMLGNIQPALQRSVRGQMTSPRLVGGDTMNYWINDFRDELLATLERLGLPAHQRQRSAPAFGRKEPEAGRGEDPEDGSEVAGDQAGRVWRGALPRWRLFECSRSPSGKAN